MYLRKVDCDYGDWLDLAQDRNQWQAYVRTVMKSPDSLSADQLLSQLICLGKIDQ